MSVQIPSGIDSDEGKYLYLINTGQTQTPEFEEVKARLDAQHQEQLEVLQSMAAASSNEGNLPYFDEQEPLQGPVPQQDEAAYLFLLNAGRGSTPEFTVVHARLDDEREQRLAHMRWMMSLKD